MQHQRLFIDGPTGKLQAIYHKGEQGKPAVVVCHPHPLHGGTMRNKVVYWMARTFEDQGMHVLRFNFRGVEESEGVWDEGNGESHDVQAALQWLAQQHPDAPLWFSGFSFGCFAGLQAARRNPNVQRMIAVAPAVNIWKFDFMQGETRPLTVIQGTSDEIVPCADVLAWAKDYPHMDVHQINGAGHFFVNQMDEMCACLPKVIDADPR
ncbi:MAG: alpha/beta fold hydrolase [Mariprofundaceae bacterium]|nr:alpha/beta fold hydrolase [Mariprofundaceae bacterium]